MPDEMRSDQVTAQIKSWLTNYQQINVAPRSTNYVTKDDVGSTTSSFIISQEAHRV